MERTELEGVNEHTVRILAQMAQQEEKISSLRRDVDKCSDTFDTIFNHLRDLEQSSGSKSWDIVKIAITAACTLITAMVSWFVLRG